MYRALPRTLSPHLRAHAAFPTAAVTRRYATKGAVPPPPPKLSFTERLRNKLWRPGALTSTQPEAEAQAASPPAVPKPSDIPGYIETFDARDLPVVGLDPGLEEWDIPVFLTNPKFHTRAAIVRAVHRATIEVHTPLLNGQAATSFSNPYTGPETLTPRVRIRVAPSGEAAFDFQTLDVEREILAAPLVAAEGLEIRAYTEEELYPSSEEQQQQPDWVVEGLRRRGWTTLRLREEVRFVLVKRVAQLTGIRVPDAEATRVKSVAELLEHLEAKPKPKKLYEVISESALPALPNVKVYESRVRPWDKERIIGRERPFEKAVEFKYPFEARGRK